MLHDFAIWRQSLKTVTELGAARVSERNVLTGEGSFEALRVAEITASAFPLTRVPPLLGRPLQPADDMQGAEPVVLLGYDVWQRQFLHDPAIIGRVMTVGRTARTVVGVMPPRFGFPHAISSYRCHCRSRTRRHRKGRPCRCSAASRTERAGRMPRRSLPSSRHALPPTSRPPTRSCGRAFAHSPGVRRVIRCVWKIWLIHAIVLLVLGAVSANVATLIFARTAMRESEMVVRHALGASRARVVAQIVTEGLVLALAAAVLGLVVAQTTIRYAWSRASLITADSLPFWLDLTLEPATIGTRCCSRSSPRH